MKINDMSRFIADHIQISEKTYDDYIQLSEKIYMEVDGYNGEYSIFLAPDEGKKCPTLLYRGDFADTIDGIEMDLDGARDTTTALGALVKFLKGDFDVR